MEQGSRGSMNQQKKRSGSKTRGSRSKSGLRGASARHDQYSQSTQKQQLPMRAATGRDYVQPPMYDDELYEEGLRPTLKQEDYYNTFAPKQKYSKRDDSNF
jgi:hypothetical protein